MGEIRNQEDLELPPRTRRIRVKLLTQPTMIGTTSAHAENTTIRLPSFSCLKNYLRARGEYLPRQFIITT